MIRLNTGKGIVKIANWEDITSRPIELGHQLLTQDNLGILAQVLDDRYDRTKFSEYLRTLPKSRVAKDN